jgi:hypothetical protein
MFRMRACTNNDEMTIFPYLFFDDVLYLYIYPMSSIGVGRSTALHGVAWSWLSCSLYEVHLERHVVWVLIQFKSKKFAFIIGNIQCSK